MKEVVKELSEITEKKRKLGEKEKSLTKQVWNFLTSKQYWKEFLCYKSGISIEKLNRVLAAEELVNKPRNIEIWSDNPEFISFRIRCGKDERGLWEDYWIEYFPVDELTGDVIKQLGQKYLETRKDYLLEHISEIEDDISYFQAKIQKKEKEKETYLKSLEKIEEGN